MKKGRFPPFNRKTPVDEQPVCFSGPADVRVRKGKIEGDEKA